MFGFVSRVATILFLAFVLVLQQQSSVLGIRRDAGELEVEASNQHVLHTFDHLIEDSALEPSEDDGDLEPSSDEADDVDEDDEAFLDDLEASSALDITDKVTRWGKGSGSTSPSGPPRRRYWAPSRRRSYTIISLRRRYWAPRRRRTLTGTAVGTGAVVGGGAAVGVAIGSMLRSRIPHLKGYWRQGECEITRSHPIINSMDIPLNPTTWKDGFIKHCGELCTRNESCVGVSVTVVELSKSPDQQRGQCQLKEEACANMLPAGESASAVSVSAFFGKPGFCCLASTSSTDFCGNCAPESVADGTDWCGRSASHCARCSGAKWCVGRPTSVAARNESLYVCNTPLSKDSNNSQMDPQVRKGTRGLKTFCYKLDKRRHYAYLQEGSFKKGVQQTCFEAFEATNPPPLAGAMKYCDRRIKHWGWTWSRIEQGDDDGASQIRSSRAEAATGALDKLKYILGFKFVFDLFKGDDTGSDDQYCFYAFPKKGRDRTQRICNAYSKNASKWYGHGYSYLSTTDEIETMPSWVEKEGRFCFWAFNVTSTSASRWPW